MNLSFVNIISPVYSSSPPTHFFCKVRHKHKRNISFFLFCLALKDFFEMSSPSLPLLICFRRHCYFNTVVSFIRTLLCWPCVAILHVYTPNLQKRSYHSLITLKNISSLFHGIFYIININSKEKKIYMNLYKYQIIAFSK